VFYEKSERLNEIYKIIAVIENDIRDTEEIIKSINFDAVYDDGLTDKFISYRDNEDRLRYLKDEQGKIERYLRKARMYHKDFEILL
jgi:hypothetical protein